MPIPMSDEANTPMKSPKPEGDEGGIPKAPADSEGTASELLISAYEKLSKLGDIISQSQLPEEDKKLFEQLMTMFSVFAESLGGDQGGGGRAPESPEQPGGSAPEAGGNPNARPY